MFPAIEFSSQDPRALTDQQVKTLHTETYSEDCSFQTVPIVSRHGIAHIAGLFGIVKSVGAFICGGYARYCASPHAEGGFNRRAASATDVDIYCPNADTFQLLALTLRSLSWNITKETDFALTYSPNRHYMNLQSQVVAALDAVQLIKPEMIPAFSSSPEAVIREFDFSIVRAAILNEKTALVDSSFLVDERNLDLRVRYVRCPVTSVLRLQKYIKKGYSVKIGELVKIFNSWSNRSAEYRHDITELATNGAVDANGNICNYSTFYRDKLRKIDI